MEAARALKYGGLALLLPVAAYVLAFEQDIIDLSLPLAPSRSGISYAIVREKVLGPYCFQCHASGRASGAGEIRFDEYELAKNAGERIHATAVVLERMPPGRPLSRYRKAILKAWFEAGMPENAQR